MNKACIFLIFLMVWFHQIKGQNTLIHTDKPYYFSGEYIFYTFCNQNLIDDTVSTRAELHSNDLLVEYYYLQVKDGCSEGYFKLPFELKSDIYQIVLLGIQKSDFTITEIGKIKIPIYNDEDLLADNQLLIQPSIRNVLSTQSTDLLTKVETRDSIDLKIDIPESYQDKINRISIAVRDRNIYGDRKTTFQENVYLDEKLINGIPVFGSREVINPGSIRNPLLFAFNPDNMHYDGTRVQADENFNLVIKPFYEKQPISFLDYVDNDIRIKERNPFKLRPTGKKIAPDSLVIKHSKLYQEEKQINRLFKKIGLQIRNDSSIVSTKLVRPNSYIDVQDYTIRGTSVDLFKEIATNLKFRSAGGGDYRARMIYEYNGITKFYSRTPLFIVNNRTTRDGAFIAKIPLQEIGFYSIYSDYEFLEKLSPMAHGGIVYLDMLDRNYVLPDIHALPSLNLQGLQSPLSYPILLNLTEGSPAVGNLLYWNPKVLPVENQIQIQFTTGDLVSEYVIEAVFYLSTGETEIINKYISTNIRR